mgnify:CR=1 FL=1
MRSKVEFAPGCHPLENPLVKQVLAHAHNCSVSTYIVGGYVRDSIASHDNRAFDIAKSGDTSKKRDVDFAVAFQPGNRINGNALHRIKLRIMLLVPTLPCGNALVGRFASSVYVQ